MDKSRTVVLAPHDDGRGAFAVLCRLARALLNEANDKGYKLQLYFLNSSAAKGGPKRLNDLTLGIDGAHKAVFVPTDNLIWLPKDKMTLAVLGAQIPDILRKWVRPLWHCWPCEPNWIRPNLPITKGPRRDWIRPDIHDEKDSSKEKWEKVWNDCGNLRELTPQLWRDAALGISMGVPQLHRIARREGFPSVEVGDWFFSVGLRGCMQESFVPPDVIAATEPDLRMIEEDEFKAREVWLTLHQSPRAAYIEHVARSPVRLRIMNGALWSGDALPKEGIEEWKVARDLRGEINLHISEIRGVAPPRVDDIRVAYIVTGKTGVWDGVVADLKKRQKMGPEEVAIIHLDRGKGTITFLEDGEKKLEFLSTVLKGVPGEERHLATCRASDFGITRSAGGVLGFAETRRPSVLVDEPGHWLGRIQREQCHEAGLCVVIPVGEFLKDPAKAIQEQANKLGTNSDLDQTAIAAANLPVGAERDLAEYLFETYIE
jgi:hypothetical protein